jgi:hypothetical protein
VPLAETIAKAKETVADAEEKTSVVVSAALDIIELGKSLATKEGKDISDILTGDPIADRAYLEAADVQAEIGRTFDWSAVPDVAFRVAGAVLSVAAAFA